MEKTVIQYCLEKLKGMLIMTVENEDQENYNQGISDAIHLIRQQLPAEKQQMEDAFNANRIFTTEQGIHYTKFETYFTNKFK